MKSSHTVLRLAVIAILALLPMVVTPAQNTTAALAPEVVAPAALQVATPSLVLGVPSSVPLAAEFNFTATFSNTGTPPDEVGFGPFIDLVFPATGTDGIYPGTAPADLYDGVTFLGASFMGAAIDPSQIFVQTFPDDDGVGPGTTGCVQHPIAVRPANDPPPPANPNLPRYYQVCGNAGDQFVTIILPFGSFVPSQPPADVTITAQMSELADLGAPLTIRGQAGFQFGYTPLNDFCCSPFDATIPVVPGGVYDSSALSGQTVTPTLMSLSKDYIGPENETATGPNFPRQYTIEVEIADDQPVSGLTITDTLPNNIQYVRLDSVTVGGASAAHTILTEPSTSTPGGTLEVLFDTPVVGGNTAELTFTFFVDRLDVSDVDVINPITGAFNTSTNTARADGTWDTPLDPRDYDPLNLPTPSAICTAPCVVIEDQSLAIQKGVTNTTGSVNGPGDVLQYTLQFQISDFFGFQNLIIRDVFTDGQRFDTSFVPRLTVNGNGYTLAATPLNAANYDVACDYTLDTFPGDEGAECSIDNSTAPNSGETTLTFRISDEITTRGQNGQLLGGCVDPTDANNPPVCSGTGAFNDGPTSGTLTFHTIIQDQFSDLHLAPGNSGDASVDHGDELNNTVTMSGTVLDIAVAPDGGLFDVQPGSPSPVDNSGAGVSIAFGELQKRIYAVNGSTTIPTFLAPGDVVTYRLTYTQPSSDFEDTRFTDYLPLPVFDAAQLITLNNTICGIPAAGVICLGPADNYHNLNARGENLAPAVPAGNPVVTPSFAINGPANRLTITYPEFDSIYNISSTIDILFSVTVTEEPFADGLFLTNQVTAGEGTTNAGDQFLDDIVQIRLGQPVLQIGKTAVSTEHVPDTDIIFTPNQAIYGQFASPGSAGIPFTPTIATDDLSTAPNDPAAAFDLFDGVLEGVDNNDLIKYAIIIENKGSSPNGAYDIAIQDILPTGMAIPPGGLNLQIYKGAGDAYGFEVVDFGTDGIYGTADDVVTPGDAANSVRIFDSGYAIRVVDPSGVNVPGSCQVHSLTSGANIIVITYDLLLANADTAGKSIINTASIIGYSGTEGGPNHLPVPLEDDAEIITNRLPGLTKSLIGTEFDVVGNNALNQAVIGEIVTYQVELKFFELETPDAQLIDTLDAGLAFVDLVSVVNSNPAALTIPSMTFNASGSCTNCTAGTGTGSNPLVENNGRTITFDFGSVVNNTDSNNLVAETITITYRAVVLNVTDNQQATQRNNAAQMTWTNATDPVNGSQTVSAENVTVVEPVVTITKNAIAAATLDAGDALTYNITLTASVTGAYDVTFHDPLPLYFTPDDAGAGGDFTATQNPAAVDITSQFALIGSGTTLDPYLLRTTAAANLDMQPGDTITIAINGTISYAAAANSTLTNTATVYWTSLNDAVIDRSSYNTDSDERTGADGIPTSGSAPLNNYAAESTIVTSVTNPLVLTKALISTSEAHTSGADVAIGEIARFRLVVEVPEGTNQNLLFEDDLPAGLTFLNDGTATMAFVCNGASPCAVSSLHAGTAWIVNGASGEVAPTYVLPDGAVSSSRTANEDLYATGVPVIFKLGDLVNNDNDADSEFAVVEFNVLVDNSLTGSNDNGDTLVNTFQAFVNLTQSGNTGGPVTLTVREPNIPFNTTANNKTASPSSGQDAGNTINYTVTYTNTGTATAFDVRILDNLNGAYMDLTDGSVSTNVTDVDCAAPSVTDNSDNALNRVDVMVGSVPVNCTVVITYSAVLTTSVVPSQSYTNTAYLTYTSLPGDHGTGGVTPGAPGSETGERTGDGGVNDYSGSDTAAVRMVDGARIKTIVATSEGHTPDTAEGSSGAPRPVAIGEIVRYRLVYQIPEGTVPDFSIRDRFTPTDGSNIAGQKFIPGTARFLFVGNGGVSSTASGGVEGLACTNNTGTYSLAQAGSPGSIPSSIIACAFGDTNISSQETSNNDVYLRDVYFKFGNLNNFDPTVNPGDSNLEFVIIEFDALVDNNTSNTTSTNDDGDVLVNTMQARYRNPTSGNLNNLLAGYPRYTVVREPLINNLNKIATTSGPYEAGSTVSYQLTYSNTGNTDAFEVQILDNLDPASFNLTLATVSTDVTDAQCAAVSPAVSNASAVNTVNVTVSRVPVGCDVVISYSATLTSAVNPDIAYDNTADLFYTSLPGDNGTGNFTPGAPGDWNGERIASDPLVEPNDYFDSDDAQITVRPIEPTKSILATSETHTTEAGDGSNDTDLARQVTVGEILRYSLVIQIPEGTSNDLIIEDQLTTGIVPIFDSTMELSALNFSDDNFDSLDFGLALEAANGATVDLHNGADFVFTIDNGYSLDLVTYASGANLLTFNLGDIVNLDLSDADGEYIQIDFNVLVTNTAGVDMGDILANTFRVQNNGGAWVTSNTIYARVVEPELVVSKSADDTTWEYGQSPVTYTIQVAHTANSTADAFDIVVTDTIPGGLTYNAGSISAPAGWVPDASAAPDLTWTCVSPACSLPLAGDPVSLTYTVTVNDQFTTPHLMGDATVDNNATVTYTSLPGTGTSGNPTGSNTPGNSGGSDGERDGSESPDHNDYIDDDTVTGGLVEYYSLGNRVWFDTDNDGSMNAGEQPVPGVLVELYDASDPNNLLFVASDFTNPGGFYLFDYLVPGEYVVAVAADNFNTVGTYNALVGYWSSLTSISDAGVISETSAPDADLVATDADDNGTLTSTAPLSGAVVTLPVTLGPSGLTEPTGEAAAQLDTVEGQGAQPDGRANMTVDFGFYQVAIGNLVYRDENVNGTYDSGTDALLENVTVELLSGDGLTVLNTTTTNASGEYRFGGQPEGDYIVRVTTPDGHVSTIDTYDADDIADPDENTDGNDNGIGNGPATVTTVQSGVVTLDAGNDGAQSNNTLNDSTGTTYDPTLDFGFTYAYALGNRVWFDTNNNSQIDFTGGEVGVNGVTVLLYRADGSGDPTGAVLASDTTANGGYYLFDHLMAGDYAVVLPANNFAAGAVLEGYWSSAAYRDASGPHAILETAAPDPDGAPDVDSDDNGQLDLFATLPGAVASRAVTLGLSGLTEPTGEGDVNSLAPGADNQGDQPDGRANMTVDFGFYKVSVGDLVWSDADREGEYDSGEPLLQGITVNLYAQDGTTLLATTTTDINGEYRFDGLPAGTYVISVIGPDGSFSTMDSFDQDDSDDPNENTDDNDNGVGLGGGEVFSNPVTLTPGDAQTNNTVTNTDGSTHNPTLDFGFTPVYALGNRVWYDTNNNRAINVGDELGIDDVSVQLFDTAGNEILVGPDGILGTIDDAAGGMLTDNGGYYLFNGLEAGEYVVVLPASNFASGAVLEGYWSSGTTRNNDASLTEIAAPDPDNDVDSDDNGTFQTGGPFAGAVVSLPVTLGPTFNEPLNESDRDVTLPGNQQGQPDAQANMTVDFGFYTIHLGNQVWNDFDNSGLLDGAEVGINGVTVALWSADSSTQLATTTTQTVGADDGVYTFTGLPQGNYIVRLPEGNFTGTGALRDYYSSTGLANGNEPAPNPDANLTDSDDNGSEVGVLGFSGGYIQTGVFALSPQAEQSFDHDQGLTTELRVDFGVFNSPQVDLAITKDDGQDYYLPGGTLTYTIVVSNNGPADVTGAVVSDSIPVQIASWTWVCSGVTGGATGCDGVADSNTNFTDTVNLPIGSSITYTVTATLDAAAVGQLTNTVSVAPPAGIVDTNASNDEAVDVDEPASLTVTKTNAVSVVAIGSQFTYDIVVTNNGGFALSDLTVVDSLPAEVGYVSAVPVPSSISGSILTWNHAALGLTGPLNPGASFTIQVTVDVTSVPTSPGSEITNSVTVSNAIPVVTATATHTDVVADNRMKSLIGTIMAADVDPVTGVVIPSVPDYTTTPEVAIGEILTYQIAIDVPAGLTMTNLKALDTMDAGLAFVRCVGIASGSLTTTLSGGFTGACNAPINPTVNRQPVFSSSAFDAGRRVEFTLGDVSATGAETLTITYEVIVLDIPANVDGVGGLNNQVTWSWDGGSLSASAAPVEIVEPDMSIKKGATSTVAPYGASITFTLDIAHTIDSTAAAFDVVVKDILPPGLAFIPGTVVTTGLPPTTFGYDAAGKTLTFNWDVFPLRETAVLTFQATFVGPAPVINTANVAWTSLPIDPGLGGAPKPLSPHNNYATERWYDPTDPSGVNDYGISDSISIRIPELPETGFTPGRVTALPAQPVDKQYAAMDRMWLEIPDLGLTMPLTGVPLTAEGWDLTWLSNQAGYLQGTTYPGDIGTMGITSHVTLADGTPGPFRNLGKLMWGNKIILHADGYRYVYEVRDQRSVLPTDLSVFNKDGYTWMTLLTCQGYVPGLDRYNYRLAVRAVLLSVEPDSSVSPFSVQSPAQR